MLSINPMHKSTTWRIRKPRESNPTMSSIESINQTPNKLKGKNNEPKHKKTDEIEKIDVNSSKDPSSNKSSSSSSLSSSPSLSSSSDKSWSDPFNVPPEASKITMEDLFDMSSMTDADFKDEDGLPILKNPTFQDFKTTSNKRKTSAVCANPAIGSPNRCEKKKNRKNGSTAKKSKHKFPNHQH
jgi:hypothetical protein